MGEAAGVEKVWSPRDLFLLWRRANQDFCCRYCGEIAWYVADPLERLANPDYARVSGVLHYANSESGELISGLKSTAFICANCGLIELVSNAALVKHATTKGLLDER